MNRPWRVGVLTGGGDSSGVNAFLRALCIGVWRRGGEVVGIWDGWAGLVEPNLAPLASKDVDRITMLPGTILGTSRTNVIQMGALQQVVENIEAARLTHLVVVGGGDTLSVAAQVAATSPIPVVAVPQTIDNDILGTDTTLGFATAVQRGIDTIHGIVPSNRAHGNPMLVEVMGRQAGWLALHIALGTEADFLAVPEAPWSVDDLVSVYREAGPAVLAIIAEGIQSDALPKTHRRRDAFGHPALEGVVYGLAELIAERVGKYPRVQVLGYVLRGGPPVSFDLQLAWSFAIGVLRALEDNRSGELIAWQKGQVGYVPLTQVVGKDRLVPLDVYSEYLMVMARTRYVRST